MKTPYQIAYEAYHSVDQDEGWNEFLSYHLNDDSSSVLSMPSFFVVARQEGEGLIIHELAGELREAVGFIPDKCKWVRFQRRDDRYREINVDKLRRIAQ